MPAFYLCRRAGWFHNTASDNPSHPPIIRRDQLHHQCGPTSVDRVELSTAAITLHHLSLDKPLRHCCLHFRLILTPPPIVIRGLSNNYNYYIYRLRHQLIGDHSSGLESVRRYIHNILLSQSIITSPFHPPLLLITRGGL